MDLLKYATNFGVGFAVFIGISGFLITIWNLVQKYRESNKLETPIYEEAIAARELEAKRAQSLWERNQELEKRLYEVQESHSNERAHMYNKLDQVLDQLQAAREEIADLSAQILELKEKTKSLPMTKAA